MTTRKLFVLAVSVWDANDYIQFRDYDKSCNPGSTDLYLFATEEEAEKYATSLDIDDDIYNIAELFEGELTDEEILELTGYETIEEFNEALAEPYSTDARVKNLGEDEKGEVAQAIVDDGNLLRDVDCPNYDFDKSLEGAVLVFWSWERYIGYARKLIEVRRAYSDDTEALLTKQDKVFATQCDILLKADEVEAADDLQEAIRERLEDGSWKWTNPGFITSAIENF